MSCYEWERGEFKIPAKEYSKFRKAIIEKHNELEEVFFNKATELYEAVVAEGKGKRKFDYKKRVGEFIEQRYSTKNNWITDNYKLYNLLGLGSGENLKPKKPKKKDLDKLSTSKGCLIHIMDGNIGFNDATKTVSWEVYEGNRACEHVHEHPLAQYLFSKLDRIEWTRGSGGEIIGNDEYNRDSRSDGGGGNYVKKTYGPKRK